MTSLVKKLWRASPPLTACAILMLAAFAGSAIGIFADPRVITGAPAWLKPAKFGLSTAIFTATLAWLFQYITIWPRFKRNASWMLSAILVIEVGIIDVQAARGTTSHFNVGDPLDGALFSIMGVLIAILWAVCLGVAWALCRQRFANRAWGWSLRLGTLIFVLGAGMGGLMIAPTAAQSRAMAAHGKVATVGGHTVGAPDGGPGIPGVGWSLEHGDLRVPHFFGLHSLQILPFLGWLVVRSRRGARLVFAAAASYLGFLGILTWQALRGQSVVRPDTATLIAFGIWAAATLLAVILTARETEQHDSRQAVLTV